MSTRDKWLTDKVKIVVSKGRMTYCGAQDNIEIKIKLMLLWMNEHPKM